MANPVGFCNRTFTGIADTEKSNAVIQHNKENVTKTAFRVALPFVLAGKPHNIGVNIS